MTPERFRVSNSQAVSDQLRAVLARAAAAAQLPAVLPAARWMVEEMERTPLELGESREFLAHAELHMRIAFVPPLYAIFGVHQPSRTVFVRRIGWHERA